MATIRARKQSDGSTRYTAIVRIRKGKILVHQECKTFALRAVAATSQAVRHWVKVAVGLGQGRAELSAIGRERSYGQPFAVVREGAEMRVQARMPRRNRASCSTRCRGLV